MAAVMDSTANGTTGGHVTKGYPVEILDYQVDSKLLCTLCKLLPRNPVQGFCGHRFCNNCIVDHLTRFAQWHVILRKKVFRVQATSRNIVLSGEEYGQCDSQSVLPMGCCLDDGHIVNVLWSVE